MENIKAGCSFHQYMKKIILFIDTTDREKAKISLSLGGKKKNIEEKKKNLSSQIVLTLISKILKENKIEPRQLTEIKVSRGPGSFTGIRVGISIANALGYSLNIPVNGKRQIASPRYK